VLFQEFPVRIDLEAPLFSVRSDDDLIVPFAIRVVFPFRLNDLSAGRLLVDCLLDRGGDCSSIFSPGCSLSCAAALKARPTPIAAANNPLVVFTLIFSFLGFQTVVVKKSSCQSLQFCNDWGSTTEN